MSECMFSDVVAHVVEEGAINFYLQLKEGAIYFYLQLKGWSMRSKFHQKLIPDTVYIIDQQHYDKWGLQDSWERKRS